jgi:hypothetical protein
MINASLESISEVEARYRQPPGEKSLGKALELLEARWRLGHQDRETGLRLFFLAWYSCAEPTGLTGLPDISLAPLTSELLAHFGGAGSDDAEFVATLAVMSEVAPWCLDHSSEWEASVQKLQARALQLRPEGFSPSSFAGRGTYGDYMQHILSKHPVLGGSRHAG